MTQRYELNEKDIDSALRYLKVHDPKNATPENAIALLKDLQAGVHMLGHNNPAQLEQLHKDLKENKQSKK